MSIDTDNVHDDDASPAAKYEAKQLFQEAYQAQLAENYEEAIEECLEAIRVDETLGNPYNDIGSYLLAKGDTYSSVRWFKRALYAPRYESYAFPHFNLGRIYETRRKYLEAARHYGKALEQQPGFSEAASGLHRMQALLN